MNKVTTTIKFRPATTEDIPIHCPMDGSQYNDLLDELRNGPQILEGWDGAHRSTIYAAARARGCSISVRLVDAETGRWRVSLRGDPR